MAFDAYGPKSSTKSDIDFEAMNKHVIETADLEERAVVTGYISAIVDLGIQKEEDARMEFKGTASERKEIEAKGGDNWFEEDGGKVYKCWVNKPKQAVAIAVDFPDIIVDKGQFFGESNPLPLRLWLGGQFYTKEHGNVVGHPCYLRENKALGDWSFSKNNVLYKMGVAAKIIKNGECFNAGMIDQLLGKSFQFTAQVYNKINKEGKSYYTEYVVFSSGLAKGQKELELVTKPILIQFNQENDPEDLKVIRSFVRNTIQKAENYEISEIKKQLEALKSSMIEDSQDPSNPTGGGSNVDSDEDEDEIGLELEVEEEEVKESTPVSKKSSKKGKAGTVKAAPVKEEAAMTLAEFKEIAKKTKSDYSEDFAMKVLKEQGVEVKTTLGRSMSAVPSEKYQTIVDIWSKGPQPSKSLFEEEEEDEWDDDIPY